MGKPPSMTRWFGSSALRKLAISAVHAAGGGSSVSSVAQSFSERSPRSAQQTGAMRLSQGGEKSSMPSSQPRMAGSCL
jgi:hypothetical protein